MLLGAAALVSLLLAGKLLWPGSRAAIPDDVGGEPAGAAAAPERNDSTVTLDSVSQRLAGILLRTVGGNAGEALMANGTITYDANRVSIITPPADGKLVAVLTDLGQRVSPGAVLALVRSSEVGQARADLARAQATADVARRNHDREIRLYAESISSQKELLEAEAAYRSAQADSAAASAKLGALGAADTGPGGTFNLTTPIGGTVVERNATPGQIVGPSASLFTVADLRHLWIMVDVYEGDLASVGQGATAEVMPRALPGDTLRGHVTFAGGVVDTATRTFRVRVEVDNPNLRLRPGMFAQVLIMAARPIAGGAGGVTIPEPAVQDLNGRSVVFVPAGPPGRFIARPITLGARAGSGLVTVISGLRPGDTIVTNGAFQLKAELTKGNFGGDED